MEGIYLILECSLIFSKKQNISILLVVHYKKVIHNTKKNRILY